MSVNKNEATALNGWGIKNYSKYPGPEDQVFKN